MKKTFIPLLVVASIALMITGCCLDRDDVVHDTDFRYKINYQNDTLIYKSNNGQVDSLYAYVDERSRYEHGDCHDEVWKEYLIFYWRLPTTYGYSTLYIGTDYTHKIDIATDGFTFSKEYSRSSIIDTTINGKYYPLMWVFYTASYLGGQKQVPAHLLYDLSYNTGIVQYRDTLGVMWTLQEPK